MTDLKEQFNNLLMTFPEPVRKYFRRIPAEGGKLDAQNCRNILEILGTNLEALMLRLLPVAKLYAVTSISQFPVGAVICAESSKKNQGYDLYLGANIEFSGIALNQSVHAEQAAVVNAWHNGMDAIRSIATSAAPCGHCRQFLKELQNENELSIITATGNSHEYRLSTLMDLLPEAFGPKDLNVKANPMTTSHERRSFKLISDTDDPLILKALDAAEKSYAPYSKNFAGCAVQLNDQNTYAGRYLENAAFNPSVSPLQSAIINMTMSDINMNYNIERAVLVEKPTKCIQKGVTELVLKSVAPSLTLEYFEAV